LRTRKKNHLDWRLFLAIRAQDNHDRTSDAARFGKDCTLTYHPHLEEQACFTRVQVNSALQAPIVRSFM
jgi:hypothetical protein